MTGEKDASIIFGLFTTQDGADLFFKKIKEMKLIARELKFIEVSPISLNENYDDIINEFKHFCSSEYWAIRNPLIKKNFLINQIKSGIEKETRHKAIEISEFQWKTDSANPLLSSNPVPLFAQSQTDEKNLSKLEKENLEKLYKFESKNYNPVKDMLENAELKEIADDGETHYIENE